MKFTQVPLNKIEQNENSRVVYKEADLSELMQSMKVDGLLQPVGVKALGQGKYEAVFGNRRIVAARKLGWDEIDVVLISAETDNDRDFLNLTENLKRQNVSVTEEGRLYLVFIERGLTAKEIAARLNIPFTRVEVALDAVHHVPKELASKIVNRAQGVKAPKGAISASAYATIASLRRSEGLNRSQFRSLLEYAQKEDTTSYHISAVAPLVKRGFTILEAVESAQKWERFTIHGFVDKGVRQKLETKLGKSLNEMVWEHLEKVPGLGLIQMPTIGGLGMKKYVGKLHKRDRDKALAED